MSWESNKTCGSKFRDSKTTDLWLGSGFSWHSFQNSGFHFDHPLADFGSRIEVHRKCDENLQSLEFTIVLKNWNVELQFHIMRHQKCLNQQNELQSIGDSKTTSLLKSSTALLKRFAVQEMLSQAHSQASPYELSPILTQLRRIETTQSCKRTLTRDFPTYIVQSGTSQVLR